MICEICSGRGWVHAKRVPAVACDFCGGTGEISWGAFARKIDEDLTTLARVRQGRSRVKTCLRVLDKVCKLLWPRGQTEMFS